MKSFSSLISSLAFVGMAIAAPDKSFVDPWPSATPATTCSTVMDEVWEEKCKTIYNDVCVTDSVQDCQVLNGKMCSTVFDDVCSAVPKTQCSVTAVQSCNVQTERKCALVKSCTSQAERVCQTVNKWIETPVLEHVCETVSTKVCREVVIEDAVADPWPQPTAAVESWPSVRSKREAEPEPFDPISHAILKKLFVAFNLPTLQALLPGAPFTPLPAPITPIVPVIQPLVTPIASAPLRVRREADAKPEADPKHKKFGKKFASFAAPTPAIIPAPVFVPAPAPVFVAPPVPVVVPQIKTTLQCEMMPKQHCKSMARFQNSEVPEEVCHTEPRDVCVDQEKCLDVPVKICSSELKPVCSSVPVKECRGVPRKVCQAMPQKVCSDLPRETCKSQPEKVCKKFLVKRPRQVCDKPATVNTQQW